MRLRSLVTFGFVVAALTVMTSPALACQTVTRAPLSMMLDDEMIQYDYGIFEQQTIASAPSTLIRDGATASVLTRFWGRPPANLSVQYEGGEWFSWLPSAPRSSCEGIIDDAGNLITPDGSTGTLGYGMAPPPEDAEGPLSPAEAEAQGTVPWHRDAPFLALEDGSLEGSLSETELAAIEAEYGPATIVDIEPGIRWRATIVVWWPTVVGLAIIASVIAVIIYRSREGRSREEAGSHDAVGA